MKTVFKVFSILTAAVLLVACADKDEPVKAPAGSGDKETTTTPSQNEFKIKAISFNIKYPSSSDTGVKAWDNRKKGIIEMLKTKNPDIVGLQECYISQRNYIVENLPQYETYGLVRNNGKTEGSGETMSVLWNKERFEMLDCGTFWLSETPDTPSKGWGAANYRDCTWVLLKEKISGKRFFHFNTHLDHQVAKAKTEGAKLIRSRMKNINGFKYPVILTGDMNAEQESDVCALFEMSNARTSTRDTDSGIACHGYGSKTQVIDHIFFEGLTIKSFRTVTGPWATYQYISDHNPVLALFYYKW